MEKVKYIFLLCTFFTSFLSLATSISAGKDNSLFLDKKGSVWFSGNNENGLLAKKNT